MNYPAQDHVIPLETVLATEQLRHRPVRAPDYEAQTHALERLAETLAGSPKTILQELVETALRLCRAHSAGISLLEEEDGRKVFRWHALAGVYAPHLGQTTPREFSPCGTVLDRDSVLLFSNLARHFTYFAEVTPPIVEALLIPFHVGGAAVGTIWVVTHDDSHYFDAEDSRLLTSLGKFAATAYRMLSSLDALEVRVAETERAEKALRQADGRKDEFLAVLAHELRSPLGSIRAGLDVLRLARDDEETGERMHAILERQVRQIVRLVDDLLEVSRITHDTLELRKERLSLAAVVDDAVDSSRATIEGAGHTLTVDRPAEVMVIDADPNRLAQVMANLLNNAVRYTNRGGQIRVSVEREGDLGVVRVRDNGTGISDAMLPHVFDMYNRGDESPLRADGLGIGLTVVSSLVQRHGGRVEARSGGPGQGSEFLVFLPLCEGAPASLAVEPAKRRALVGLPPGWRVLIVEDDADAADGLAMLLSLMGSDVQIVHNGPDALAALPSYLPTVVLLDIGMPGMDGYEVARRIRRRPELDSLILVALTGWGREEDRRLGIDAGFDHHLMKPVDLDAFQSLLATIGLTGARGVAT